MQQHQVTVGIWGSPRMLSRTTSAMGNADSFTCEALHVKAAARNVQTVWMHLCNGRSNFLRMSKTDIKSEPLFTLHLCKHVGWFENRIPLKTDHVLSCFPLKLP